MNSRSFAGAPEAAVGTPDVCQREVEWRLSQVERELSQLPSRVRNDILQDILMGVYALVVVGTIVLVIATAVVRAGGG